VTSKIAVATAIARERTRVAIKLPGKNPTTAAPKTGSQINVLSIDGVEGLKV
jgi:hypothetical protein